MKGDETKAAWDCAEYNAERARNCERVVESMKYRISTLRIELKDALFVAYGAECNWPAAAKSALGE